MATSGLYTVSRCVVRVLVETHNSVRSLDCAAKVATREYKPISDDIRARFHGTCRSLPDMIYARQCAHILAQ